MTRALLVAVCLAASARGQTPGGPVPILFSSEWDVHGAPVRFRRLDDSATGWSIASARRFDGTTFSIVNGQEQLLRAPPSTPLRIEARVRKSGIRWSRVRRGAAAGALVGAALVIHHVATCKDPPGAEVSCQFDVVGLPIEAAASGIAGALVAFALPVREWRTVSRIVR